MNRIHHLMRVSAVLALSAWACGVEEEAGGARVADVDARPKGEAAPLRAVSTELSLLAEASPSPDHWIGIYELPEGGIGVFETGDEGEPSLLEGWDHEGLLVDYLRASVPDAVIGEAADAAERAGLARAPRTPDAPPVMTPQAAPIDPILDAIRWTSDVCYAPEDFWGNQFSWYDDIDCRTNVGSTTIVSNPTVDYEAKVMNAGTNLGNATVVVQELRGAEVINLGTWELRGRKWGTAMFRATARYQIAVFGPKNHMSVRTRRPMPDARELNDYPFSYDDMPDQLHEDTQGVANDGQNWYFTNESLLAKYTVGADLEGPSNWHTWMPPILQVQGFDHFGDLVYANGLLYIPIEATSGANIRGIAVFDTNLNFIGRTLINQPSAAWLAFNPQDGHFYTAPTFDFVWQLNKYDIIVNGSTVTANLLGQVNLTAATMPLLRLQGGEFSPKGNLYVTADSDLHGGVWMIDVLTGFAAKRATLHFQGWGEELEGLTIWDLDSGAAPGIEGQIHVLMVRNDGVSDDALYFKHMRASPLGDL